MFFGLSQNKFPPFSKINNPIGFLWLFQVTPHYCVSGNALKVRRKCLPMKKICEKKLKNIFSSKTKNIILRLKHIQRTTSNSISKCSHVSISHLTKFSNPMASPGGMLYSSINFQNTVFIFN